MRIFIIIVVIALSSCASNKSRLNEVVVIDGDTLTVVKDNYTKPYVTMSNGITADKKFIDKYKIER